MRELGYDDFERNSFRKKPPETRELLQDWLVSAIAYSAFLRQHVQAELLGAKAAAFHEASRGRQYDDRTLIPPLQDADDDAELSERLGLQGCYDTMPAEIERAWLVADTSD